MITRNLIMGSLKAVSSGSPAYKDMEGNIHDDYSSSYFLSGLNDNNFIATKKDSISGNYPKSTFILGLGDTPVTVYDYTLADEVDYTNFTIVNASYSSYPSVSESSWETYKKVYTQNWTYTGTDSLTIKEVGLVVYLSWNGIHYDLAAREVLQTPISVKTGDTFTVSMTLG